MTHMQFSIVIYDRQGSSRVHALKDGESIIGCDPGADICVASEPALMPKHILVAPRPEHCWVSTSKGAPLYDDHGRPIEAAFVPWGTQMRLGDTRFSLQAAEITYDSGNLKKPDNQGRGALDTGGESLGRPRGPHPLLVMLLLSTIAFLGFGLLPAKASTVASLPDEELDLFFAAKSCSRANALHRAEQAEHAALAKSERSVFYLQDGIAAVALFEEAAACYRVAGISLQAEQNDALASELRDSLTQDYQRMRLRLERALIDGQTQVASEQVRRLQELLHHQPESATFLELRRLALRLSRKN